MAGGREVTPKDVKATERLKIYWTKGPGAVRIQWGTPGDFKRCEAELGRFVSPAIVAGLCSNYHQAATGFRPGHAPSEGGNGHH